MFEGRFHCIGRICFRARIDYLLCRLDFVIMKKTLLFIFVILAAGFRNPGTQDLTSAERNFAINYLNQTL